MKITTFIMMVLILTGIPTLAIGSVYYDEYNPVVDTSNDGLSTNTDSIYKINTNQKETKNRIDTDKDGFIDRVERNNTRLNPNKKDIVVVVDYARGINRQNFSTVKKKFKNAPVENPDGTEGVDLHILHNKTITDKESFTEQEFTDAVNKSNNHRQKGFYYGIIADQINKHNTDGLAWIEGDSFIVEKSYNTETTEATFMHEVGHVIGLTPTDFAGIDSPYNRNKYDSIMNYNQTRNTEYPRFSSGGDFDDWEHIEENLKEENPR